MAVYKPSNCSPFLGSVDLTKKQYLECELNTSNVPVTGYKIQILDNLNNIIFEGKQYTKLPDRWNGSILRVPLIVTDDKASIASLYSGTLRRNVIWYGEVFNEVTNVTEMRWQYFDEQENKWKTQEKFYNGYANQPYKWKINLAQGDVFDSYNYEKAPSSRWYDMTITTGQVLGTVPNRLQGPYSDKIYKDYYVQLCRFTYPEGDVLNTGVKAASFVGPRVHIVRYDGTFGYLYPCEGAFSEEDIRQATYFQVYKDTNDPEYISAARMVDYATTRPLRDIPITYNGVEYSCRFAVSTKSKYYYDQMLGSYNDDGEFVPLVTEDLDVITPLIVWYDTGGPEDEVAQGSTRFLFKNEYASTPSNPSSKYNGVFTYAGYMFLENETDVEADNWKSPFDYQKGDKVRVDNKTYLCIQTFDPDLDPVRDKAAYDAQYAKPSSVSEYWRRISNKMGTPVLRWQRPASANSWANFIQKAWYVTNGTSQALNFESNAQANAQQIGTIDSEPLQFTVEKPIEIYPNAGTWQEKCFGILYKGNATTTYVRPFVGLNSGMLFKYVTDDGVENSLTFTSIDTQSWAITHAPRTPFAPGTPYTITSYFKLSDENPFYAYDTPKIEAVIDTNCLDPDSPGSREEGFRVAKRFIDVEGIYTQAQNKSWINYSWTLTDLTINRSTSTETTYQGTIDARFDGLQDNHRYSLMLTVEDELGLVHTDTINFYVKIAILYDGLFDLEVAQDCGTQAVDLNFIKGGVVIPSPTHMKDNDNIVVVDGGLEYRDHKLIIDDAGADNNIIDRGYGVQYNEVGFYVGDASAPTEVTDTLAGPESKNMTQNSAHILGTYFEGAVYDITIECGEVSNFLYRIRIEARLPHETMEIANESENAILDETKDRSGAGLLDLNPNRNYIYMDYWIERKNAKDEDAEWLEEVTSRDSLRAPIEWWDKHVTDMWREDITAADQDRIVVFGMAPAADVADDSKFSEQYDYIATDVTYNIQILNRGTGTWGPLIERSTRYQNLMGDINSQGKRAGVSGFVPLNFILSRYVAPNVSNPLYLANEHELYVIEEPATPPPSFAPYHVTSIPGNIGTWTDSVIELAKNLDGSTMSVTDTHNTYRWYEYEDANGGYLHVPNFAIPVGSAANPVGEWYVNETIAERIDGVLGTNVDWVSGTHTWLSRSTPGIGLYRMNVTKNGVAHEAYFYFQVYDEEPQSFPVDIPSPEYPPNLGRYWYDISSENPEVYLQASANSVRNHSGRQKINKYEIHFNVAIENYNPLSLNPWSVFRIMRHCYMRDKNHG